MWRYEVRFPAVQPPQSNVPVATEPYAVVKVYEFELDLDKAREAEAGKR